MLVVFGVEVLLDEMGSLGLGRNLPMEETCLSEVEYILEVEK